MSRVTKKPRNHRRQLEVAGTTAQLPGKATLGDLPAGKLTGLDKPPRDTQAG